MKGIKGYIFKEFSAESHREMVLEETAVSKENFLLLLLFGVGERNLACFLREAVTDNSQEREELTKPASQLSCSFHGLPLVFDSLIKEFI